MFVSMRVPNGIGGDEDKEVDKKGKLTGGGGNEDVIPEMRGSMWRKLMIS